MLDKIGTVVFQIALSIELQLFSNTFFYLSKNILSLKKMYFLIISH